ncbi:HD domain-containing protein [Stenotrophomonas sp. NPDC087984]
MSPTHESPAAPDGPARDPRPARRPRRAASDSPGTAPARVGGEPVPPGGPDAPGGPGPLDAPGAPDGPGTAPARAGGEPVPPCAPGAPDASGAPGPLDASDAPDVPDASDSDEARGTTRPGPRDRDESAAQWPSRAARPTPAAPRLPNALRGSLGWLAERHDRALHRARRQQSETATARKEAPPTAADAGGGSAADREEGRGAGVRKGGQGDHAPEDGRGAGARRVSRDAGVRGNGRGAGLPEEGRGSGAPEEGRGAAVRQGAQGPGVRKGAQAAGVRGEGRSTGVRKGGAGVRRAGRGVGVRKGGVGVRWASRGAGHRERGLDAQARERERISGRRYGGLTVVAVYGAAGALAVVALVWTEWHGVRQPEAALAFGALIAVGEAIRCVEAPPALPGGSGVPDPRGEPAPVAAAGALGYALLGRLGGEPTTHGVLQVVTVVVAASLAGLVAPLALGCPVDPGHTARRVLTVAFAAVCFQPLHRTGLLGSWFGHSPYLVGYLLALLAVTALCDAVLAAALARARTGWPYGPLLRDELRSLPGVAAAVCATAVVMPLTVAVAGLWPVPVLAVPLLLIQYSYRRYAGIRATYRQTIASLARSTEIAGYTPTGHAREVAALSRAVGRELGLSEPRLTVLEYAALMHDIGQLSLVDPVPAGATEPLPAAEQREIALLGGAVVRQTGVPAEVAQVVERQADPYREQPLAARIVRAVNAYTELVSGPGAEGAAGAAALRALERLRLATARDFDPIVVETLATVLSRQVYGRPR